MALEFYYDQEIKDTNLTWRLMGKELGTTIGDNTLKLNKDKNITKEIDALAEEDNSDEDIDISSIGFSDKKAKSNQPTNGTDILILSDFIQNSLSFSVNHSWGEASDLYSQMNKLNAAEEKIRTFLNSGFKKSTEVWNNNFWYQAARRLFDLGDKGEGGLKANIFGSRTATMIGRTMKLYGGSDINLPINLSARLIKGKYSDSDEVESVKDKVLRVIQYLAPRRYADLNDGVISNMGLGESWLSSMGIKNSSSSNTESSFSSDEYIYDIAPHGFAESNTIFNFNSDDINNNKEQVGTLILFLGSTFCINQLVCQAFNVNFSKELDENGYPIFADVSLTLIPFLRYSGDVLYNFAKNIGDTATN